ncbi:MAG: TetR/AcrR family transcriptional regulator [Kineosporiaceae bacterium]|nr:TetR/AcrR family transcriptional regulator [Aeromicrobium sp.]
MTIWTTSAAADTASRILDVAERLVQLRGYNAFSYADVAAELGLTKAALHYHFASKAALGIALINRHTSRFFATLADVDSLGPTAAARVTGYTELYARVLRQHRMCLCGMLAADYLTLPEPMRAAVIAFFNRNEAWMTSVLEKGVEDGSLRLNETAADAASALVGAVEGLMLVARAYDDVERFERSAAQLVAALTK